MHMLIAFVVAALVIFFPVLWLNALAHSFDVPGRTNYWTLVLQTLGVALGVGLVAALLVGGLWEVWFLIVALWGG